MRNALAYSALKLYQSRGKKSSDSVACGKSRRDGGIPASLSAVYLRTAARKDGRSPQKVLTAARVAAYITSMKITVYAISKNEEKFAARWAKSMSEADEIVVLDTGSTDDTVGILTAAGVRVKQAVIEPWRFDVARNESLKLVSEDTDVCVCTDLDEVFEPGWRAALEKSWAPDIVQGRYRYIWSHVEGGKPGVEFYAEKVHALHGFRWVNPVHEVLACSLPARKVATLEGVTLHHYPDDAKSRAAYLPLLELAVKEDPANDRNAHYLGREYYFRGRYDEAIRELRRHLALKTAAWTDERAASMRYIARCCRALNRYKSDLRVREQNLRVISDHNVISTESRHIFYDHCSDLSVFYIGHHPFEVGAIEIRPRITVIDIIPAIRKTVCFRIISENFFLMHYTVAVTDLIVVAA